MTSFSWFQDQKSWYTTGSCSTGMRWWGHREHQAKLLSETANLLSLEDKLDRLCALEKSESSSATLSGQVQTTPVVKAVEVKKTEPS